MRQGAWPDRAEELIRELRQAPARLALVVDDPIGQIMAAYAEWLHAPVSHADSCLLMPTPAASPDDVMERLAAAGNLITDLDILFWRPWLGLDPLGVLRAVSRRHPGTIFAWPGVVHGGRVSYSTPGRPDFYEAILVDAVILRPQPTTFPDDPPYRIERYAG